MIKQAILHDKLYISATNNKYLSDFVYNVNQEVIVNYETVGDLTSLPSEAIHKLQIDSIVDKRVNHKSFPVKFHGKLKPDQQEIADLVFKDSIKSCLIQAKCGWGKTFLGTYIVAKHAKPALIICHTKLLANQWFNELNKLVDAEIGFIGDGKFNVKPITVGMYQTLVKRIPELKDKFDLLIVDEAHRCPARVFSSVINGLSSRVKIALTATPVRKDGLHVLLPDYFGPIRFVAKEVELMPASVEIIRTDVPFTVHDPKREWAKATTKLSNNDIYLNMIATRIRDKIAHKRCVLVISNRIEALNRLNELIPKSVLLIGATDNKSRDDILAGAGTKYDAILTTTIFDEGISCHRLDTLALIMPSNNPGNLEQRIGRIQRQHPDKRDPLIMDFWLRGTIVSSQQRKRLLWYKQKDISILE